MTRLHATLIALALCAAPRAANAAPSEFDRIVRAVEAQTGVPRLHLFGMGFLFRAATWVSHPAGASDMRVAVFSATDSRTGFSSAQFEGVLTHALDSSWHLTLRTSSAGDQSQTIVWIRPDRKHTDLIVGIAQPNNGVLTAFRLSTERLKEWLAQEEARTPAH